MEDFCKLLPCRAPVKLMVFGYHEERGKTEASFGRLSSLMKALIARSGDDAGYVLFGLAWRSRRYSTSIRSDGAWLDVVDHPLWLGEDFTPNP
jgi:hypothetical protein